MTRSKAKKSDQSQLVLVTDSDPLDMKTMSDALPKTKGTPVWTTHRSFSDPAPLPIMMMTSKDGSRRERRITAHEQQMMLKQQKRAERHQKKTLRRAQKVAQHTSNAQRYMQLHNSMSTTEGEKMSLEQVQIKFRRKKYVLPGEIQRLEGQQCESMIADFGKVGVED